MFIKLTDHKNGKPIYVNKAYVSLVYTRRSENGEVTVVELAGLGTAIIKVNESVEEVMGLIEHGIYIHLDDCIPDDAELLRIIKEKREFQQLRKE